MKNNLPSRRPFYRLTAVMLGLAVAVALAEITVRVFSLAPGLNRVSTDIHRLSNDPQLRYELIPWTFAGYEAINGQGRRDFNYNVQKPKGVFRIVTLGDSATFGWGVNLWSAHPTVTEYYLNKYKKQAEPVFEVLNFGVRGYGSQEEARCLETKALPYDPNLVVVLYNLNDPDPYSVDLAWALSRMDAVDDSFKNTLANSAKSHLKKALYEHVKLFTFAKYRIEAANKNRTDKAKNEEGAWLVRHRTQNNYEVLKKDYFYRICDQYWERVTAAFAKFGKISREKNIPVMVAILPVLDDLSEYQYKPIHERVSAEAEKNGLKIVDLLPYFQTIHKTDPDLNLAIDFNHPNQDGHNLTGWAVAVNLVKSGLVPVNGSGFDPELFDMNITHVSPSVSAFENQDMYHLELGLIYMALKDFENALASFQKARRLNPGNELVAKCASKLALQVEDANIKNKALGLVN